VQARVRELVPSAPRHAVDVLKVKRFEPAQQVVARLELSGPARRHAGLDVRGDGSLAPFTGRFRRRLIKPRPGEEALAALRRELEA
jgi:hypothetical protein